MADIRVLVNRIEDLLAKVKEEDRRQKRRIRELENIFDINPTHRYDIPDYDVPGGGRITKKDSDPPKDT